MTGHTESGTPFDPVYGPEALRAFDPASALGEPGGFPYTRGVYPAMYTSRPWTMRQYAGFGTATESNARYRELISHGTTGLSVAFDLPTQMGLDSDAELAAGEVGRVGVAIDSIDDMRTLFAGIPLGEVSTSMTINAPAAVLLLLYELVAAEQGVPPEALTGTIQNDVLKEYIARGTYIYPPAPSLRLVSDTFAYCRTRLPRWNTISISGYHMAEAGATPAQEIAFTLADGIAYVEAALAAGLAVDDIAPRLSFFFVARTTLLEEVAKFRAARRIWAHTMRDRFGAVNPKSQMLRFHTQTAGVQLTAQQPEVNLVRVTVQALAAVLGGTQSLHTNSFDEALALPTPKAARLALRTQQVLAYETDVTKTVDPFAGSYVVESLTDAVEAEALRLMGEVAERGGAVAAIEQGFQKAEIERSAYQVAREVDAVDRVVVGVNRFVLDTEEPYQPLQVDPATEAAQTARLSAAARRPGHRGGDRGPGGDPIRRLRHGQPAARPPRRSRPAGHGRRGVRRAARRLGGLRAERTVLTGPGSEPGALQLRVVHLQRVAGGDPGGQRLCVLRLQPLAHRGVALQPLLLPDPPVPEHGERLPAQPQLAPDVPADRARLRGLPGEPDVAGPGRQRGGAQPGGQPARAVAVAGPHQPGPADLGRAVDLLHVAGVRYLDDAVGPAPRRQALDDPAQGGQPGQVREQHLPARVGGRGVPAAGRRQVDDVADRGPEGPLGGHPPVVDDEVDHQLRGGRVPPSHRVAAHRGLRLCIGIVQGAVRHRGRGRGLPPAGRREDHHQPFVADLGADEAPEVLPAEADPLHRRGEPSDHPDLGPVVVLVVPHVVLPDPRPVLVALSALWLGNPNSGASGDERPIPQYGRAMTHLDPSWTIVASYETTEHNRAVDVFSRPDGSFGFEEFRRDPEDMGTWYDVAYFAEQRFGTRAEAERAAASAVGWLDPEASGDPRRT